MKTCTSETTMKYLRQARPWLLSHSLAHDIEFLEQTHPGHFLEFNERGGFFHWIIRPRNHIFGPQFIMTQLPEVMRPFREVWGEYTNKHYRGVLNGELFAKTMPPPVDTFVYMTSKPPYSAEELFKIRNNANIDHWSLLADLRAVLDSTGIITYQRIW